MATPDERLENLNLTQEEMKNMTGMMKDPKFMELFADYANEISDPNNRKEMENALRDAESRGETVPGFPSDKDLLIPLAAFCAKTRNEKTGAKVFINVCYSEKIAKPKGTEAKDRSGTAWEIPYSLGPAQTDKDKHFSLPKLKYKGQTKEPKMLTIPKGTQKPPPSPPPAKAGVEGPDQVTKRATAEKRLKPAADSENLITKSEPGNKGSPTSGEEVVPKYKVVYRNHLSFTKFWDDTVNLPTEKDKPTHVVLRVDLPNVIKMKDIDLKITEREIHLVVPSRYQLQLKLRYRVDEGKGQAKFDTSKQHLEITLPICDPPPQAPT